MTDPLRTPFVHKEPAWDGYTDQTMLEEIASRQWATQTVDKMVTFTPSTYNVGEASTFVWVFAVLAALCVVALVIVGATEE